MRKLLAISMLLVMLFSQTEFHQLFRLPALFEHYQEHKKGIPELSFLEFLSMHYDSFGADADYKRDQQLPFRDVDSALVFFLLTDTPPQSVGLPIQHAPVKASCFSKERESFSPQLFLKDIFQPPRAFLS